MRTCVEGDVAGRLPCGGGSRVLPQSASPIHSLLAYARALRDPATYDPRSNAGLWLGFMLAIPIPVMAIALSAPLPVILPSLFAPLGWGVIVGAASRVGTIREDLIRALRVDARKDARLREETYAALRSEASSERIRREDLARVVALAEAELALAQVVHEGVISRDVEGRDLCVRIRHTPHAYIGGDYIHASQSRPDLLHLILGDVAGHGVAAALVVSRIHAIVLQLTQQDARPAAFLDALERAALDLLEHTSLFITLVVMRIDTSARTIEYGTAGHPAQFLRRAGASVDELFTPNIAPGLPRPIPPRAPITKIAAYEPGDTLLLFTDGLYEVTESSGRRDMWGEEALKALFAREGGADPDVVADRILEAAEDFHGAQPVEDDVSLVVVRL